MSGNIGFTDNNLQFLIIKHNSNRIYWALEVLLKTHRPCLSSIFQIIVTNGHKDIGPIVNCACCMSGTIVYIPDTEVNKRDRSLYFLWSLHFSDEIDQVWWCDMEVKRLFKKSLVFFNGRTDSRNLTASFTFSIWWASLNALHISASNNDEGLTAASWPEVTEGIQPKYRVISTRLQVERANVMFPKPIYKFPL